MFRPIVGYDRLGRDIARLLSLAAPPLEDAPSNDSARLAHAILHPADRNGVVILGEQHDHVALLKRKGGARSDRLHSIECGFGEDDMAVEALYALQFVLCSVMSPRLLRLDRAPSVGVLWPPCVRWALPNGTSIDAVAWFLHPPIALAATMIDGVHVVRRRHDPHG
jgi:hypothetical protein